MTTPSSVHSSFAIEREYPVPVATVFAAWAVAESKRRWFAGPSDWAQDEHTLRFTVGGIEHAGGGPPGGPHFTYDARYEDIVTDVRIVTTARMHRDDRLTSIAVATVEFEPAGPGATRLIYTEQDVFLDDLDDVDARRGGTEALLGKLAVLFDAADDSRRVPR